MALCRLWLPQPKQSKRYQFGSCFWQVALPSLQRCPKRKCAGLSGTTSPTTSQPGIPVPALILLCGTTLHAATARPGQSQRARRLAATSRMWTGHFLPTAHPVRRDNIGLTHHPAISQARREGLRREPPCASHPRFRCTRCFGMQELIDELNAAERALLGEALTDLRSKRAAAWNAACDVAKAQRKRRPSLRGYEIGDIKRLARRLGTRALHWSEE